MGSAWNPDGNAWVDKGLGGFLKGMPQYAQFAGDNEGKHRVPTLRNVDLRPDNAFVKPFMHNGFFKSVKEVVHFYNTRDANGFPPPEISANIIKEDMGNLGLTGEEEDAIVAFSVKSLFRCKLHRGSSFLVIAGSSRLRGEKLFKSLDDDRLTA
jgi:cytochrome c peroxidase